MLFFGMVLVFVGTGIQGISKNSDLAIDGWFVVAIAIILWVLKESKGGI
jgi:hypothetical protein